MTPERRAELREIISPALTEALDEIDRLERGRGMQEDEFHALEHLQACERIRSRLDLPVEALALIDLLMRRAREGASAQRPGAMPERSPLRLRSEGRIPPNRDKPTFVSARPQGYAMRVEALEILANPRDWKIADVLVGSRSQFQNGGSPLAGRLFLPGMICHGLTTEPISMTSELHLLVHYVGPWYEGEFFEAVAMGSRA